MNPATIAQRLAAEMVAVRATALDATVVTRANELLLDHLGVTIGGVPAESSVAIRRGLTSLGFGGSATVIGSTERLPPPQAALANGAAAHARELDDTHRGGSVHLGASVFPAALAASELAPASGTMVLRAAVAGFEVAARVAMALDPAAHYRRGFHPTGTCGAFGATVAAGLLLGLDAPQLAHALGIAGSQASGAMEFLADGTWTKRFHPGWAACAGLHAAAIARAGFRAPSTIFEGRFGVLHDYSDGAREGPLAGDGTWALMATSIKPHACCRYMQGPIDAVLALRAEQTLEVGAIARIEVGMLAAALAIVCEPAAAKRRPQTTVDAQFSLPFGVAVALAHGRAGPDEFVPAVFESAAVRALMDRVEMVHDPALDRVYPRDWPSWVRIHLHDGRVLERALMHPSGDPENFLDPAALEAKCRRLATPVLGAAAVDHLLAAVHAFPTAPDTTALLASARPPLPR